MVKNFPLKLALNSLKNSSYVLQGALLQSWWYGVCHALNIAQKGGAVVDLTFTQRGEKYNCKGTIVVNGEWQCVRSLTHFMAESTLSINDTFTKTDLQADGYTPEEDTNSILLQPYICQQILLNIDPYPIAPTELSKNGERGAYSYAQQRLSVQEEPQKPNPFAVLKEKLGS